jgi:hypothetical protein
VSAPARFDPYALLEALDTRRVTYVVVGGFARVVHGSAELTRGLDITPSLREENLRRLARALEDLGAQEPAVEQLGAGADPLRVQTKGGELQIVPEPWGTRGYEDLRIRANRDNLGRGVRPPVASVVDCVRMLEASPRDPDTDRVQRLRRMMELDRQLVRHRGLYRER